MPPKPDLASHTLSSFLDRFVYRNAKAAASGPRGGSIMQPLSGGSRSGILITNKSSCHTQGPVNTEAFWKKKADDVAVDEVFFHKYFSQIGKGKQDAKKKGEKKKAGEGYGDEEEENEDEIWEALVSSRPDVEGPSDDDDSDMEMLDLDESDDEISDADEMDVVINDEDDFSDVEDGLDGSEDEEDGGAVLDDGESEVDSDMDALFANELQTAKANADEEVEGKETSRSKRKKLKGLPTFASADDYAAMLDNDEDEDF